MNQFKIYLAGPITGLKFGEAQDWRHYVKQAFAGEPRIRCVSPLRGKQFLLPGGRLSAFPYFPNQTAAEGINSLATDTGILRRDHWDCMTADAILVNLMGAEQPSLGTVMEIGWGFAYGKPLVIAMDTFPHLHDHPMIRAAASHRVTTLDDAVKILQTTLLGEID